MKILSRAFFAVAFIALLNSDPANAQECTEPTGSAQCPYSLNDYPASGIAPYNILYAYELNNTLEELFDGTDGVLTPFWDNWKNGTLDYIEMRSDFPGNKWERSSNGFSGSEDATMLVYAAWGARGLYLCFEVEDNQFCDFCLTNIDGQNPDAIDWANDAMDIYLDAVSTDVHKANPSLYTDSQKRITRTMVQIQYRFGNAAPAETFSRNKTNVEGIMEYRRDITFEDAKAEFNGMIGETVTLGETRKAQEWFIPYDQVGTGSFVPDPSNPSANKIAFSAGYNDADGSATAYDALRWINAGDPSKSVPPPGGGVFVPVEAWGDIQYLGESPIPNEGSIKAIHINRTNLSEINSVEYFDMKGRVLGSYDVRAGKLVGGMRIAAPANSVVFEKVVFENGASKTQSLLLARSLAAMR